MQKDLEDKIFNYGYLIQKCLGNGRESGWTDDVKISEIKKIAEELLRISRNYEDEKQH